MTSMLRVSSASIGMLASAFFLIFASGVKAEKNYVLDVGTGNECPKFTKPRISLDGYCRPFVKNEFTGAYLNGSCPAGSAPVGSGYCMYDD